MPVASEEVFLSFLAEWFDPLPQLTRQYRLKYFEDSNEAEMVDVKTKRLFLKRSPCPESMTLKDFRIGAKIVLYGRELTLAEYGDEDTRKRLSPALVQTVLVINPQHFGDSGKLLDALLASPSGAAAAPLTLARLRLFRLRGADARDVARALAAAAAAPRDAADAIATALCHGPVLAAAVLGEGAVAKLSAAAARVSRDFAEKGEAAVWAAPDEKAAAALGDILFGRGAARLAARATLDACTCCVIKPHAVKAGHAGRILDHVLAQGYEVTALDTVHLDRVSATEFFEVYQGAVPEYKELVDHMITSPCIAMEVRAEDAVATFRQTAGPWDVEMAKELRPGSLRALFGRDNVRSGVHCTELPEDGVAECQYFFEVLQS
ncbi:nucleoside diphosphate kinase [Tribonema minus]|uniref:Nucleoside diphosphate kinase n=1 Tax=Tribonema minus TaxID=303371 RepID=A0A835YQV2_9STRA|nr:nucleoside diphosphate kinase [Tribonema minus]